MRSGSGSRRVFHRCSLFALVALAACASTVDPGRDLRSEQDVIESPDPSGDAVPGDLPGPTDTHAVPPCLACLAPGTAFRVDRLRIERPSEPAGVTEFLDAVWSPDICNRRLNLVVVTERVDALADGGAVVTFGAGSAWHDDPGATKGVDCPGPPAAQTLRYRMIEGTRREWVVRVDPACRFETVAETSLVVHPGPADAGLFCSAGGYALGVPPDSVDVSALTMGGVLAPDCGGVSDGSLAGCIAHEAACSVCSFLAAPDYATLDREHPDPGAEGTPCTSGYCALHCNVSGWVNLGAFLDAIGTPLDCPKAPGTGYDFRGAWSAERVAVGDPE
mgnify:CR=1 FL=1